MTQTNFLSPSPDCPLCPRLASFRTENRQRLPACHNAPVPSFGGLDAQMLVVGLAPGLKGANCSGRPFTGDYAGLILYNALLKHGFASGAYKQEKNDGLQLHNCRITNAVRCVPPENKPETLEIKNCNAFLQQEIATMPRMKLILSLGLVSHNAVLRALKLPLAFAKFRHEGQYRLNDTITLLDSYHCSRYNINTGKLTPDMFDHIIAQAASLLN